MAPAANANDPAGLKRLLGAVGYPRVGHFSIDEAAELCKAVAWVEDRLVRLYDIEQRAPLRAPGPGWDAAFTQYLRDLECPYPWDAANKLPALRWLCAKAVACEYEDAGATYNAAAAAGTSTTAGGASSSSAAAAAGGGGGSTGAGAGVGEEEAITEDVKARVAALAERLGVTPAGGGGEVLPTLQAVLSAVQMRLSPAALEAAKEGQAAQLQIDDFELSYSTKDPVVDRLARALTMLYVADLRELQSDINDILVSAQNFTANPKTNTALGKVGR